MESHPIRWCAITLFSLTVFSLSGCAASQKVLQQSFLLAWLPERGDDPADVAHFGPLPSQEIEQLHELSEQAADSDPAVQRRLAVDLAYRLQNEQDPLIRVEVARTLCTLRVSESLESLQQAANDGDPDVRIAVCSALGQQGGLQAAETLSQIVHSDTNLDVRLAATRELEGFRELPAMQALAVALDDPDPAMQYTAIQSLREVSPVDYGGDVGAWRQFAQGGTPPAIESDSISVAGWLRRRFR